MKSRKPSGYMGNSGAIRVPIENREIAKRHRAGKALWRNERPTGATFKKMRDQPTKGEFLYNIFYVLFKRKYAIAFLFSACFVIILFGTYLITPTYKATTKILVHLNPSQQLILFRDLASPSQLNPRVNPANNLIQISKGQSIAEEIVKTFELDKRLQERREHPTASRDKMKNSIVSVMMSPFTLAQSLGLLQKREPNYMAEAVEDFIANIQDVTLEEDTEIVNLTINEETPELASNMANTMAHLLIQKTKELTQVEASDAYEFTKEQVAMAEERLREAEDELSLFKEREGIVSLSEEKRGDLGRLESLETEYTLTNTSLEEVRLQLLEAPDNAISATIMKNNPSIGDLVSSLNSLEIRYASLEQEYTSDHPEITALRAQISENRAKLSRELESVLDGLRARKEALSAEIESLRVSVETFPRKEVELARLTRNVSALEERARTLSSKLLELEVQQVSQMGEFDIKIIDRAYIPENAPPDHPNLFFFGFAGIMASLVLALACIFSFEYWGDTVRNPGEVADLLKVPTLGTVPAYGRRWRLLRRKPQTAMMAVKGSVDSQGVNKRSRLSSEQAAVDRSFHLIVDNLFFKIFKKQGEMYLVTSAAGGEGKTTVAANLASCLVRRGKRTLLIDANMRAPRIHSDLGLDNSRGLIQLLKREVQVEDVLQSHEGDNLNVITSGHAETTLFDPSWLTEFEPFLHEFQKRFDIILFDSPSLEAFVDSLMLNSFCDGIILVVRAEYTQKGQIRVARDKVRETGKAIVGTVFNGYRNPIPPFLRKRLQLSGTSLHNSS